MEFWKDKKVLVTGGTGFIGSYVVEMLLEKKANVFVVDKAEASKNSNLSRVLDKVEYIQKDLFNIDNCLQVTKGKDVILNIAAVVGGINYNQHHQSEMFFNNVRINANMLEASRLNKVKRFLVVSSACVYPRHCLIPTPETEGMRFIPEGTNEGYGLAKRMAEAQGQAYAREFGMEVAIARPYNAYGPRDCFDPEKSHVIPALIKRIFDGEDPLVVWGDGEQSRAFLYVEDFARGLIEVTEKYSCADPVNIGTTEEIKIKDLVNLIVKLSGKNPKIVFDASKPSGQPRRNCDNAKAKKKVGFSAKVNLEEGLKRTIEWYRTRKNRI
ncbi:MAG: GDP-L-fucose synthase [Elusimicrobia bacterium ADurb.Bin231]|nr:MAG: GDP-L-fucose synthase [Elusimicrobia bacterium ADurb.Bin231]